MLNGLQEEIGLHPELTCASKEIVINTLNADGTANIETYVTIPHIERKITISKAALLTHITQAERKNMRALIASCTDAGEDLKMLYEADDVFWVNDPTFIGMIDSLSQGGIISVDAASEIKRLGERSISRAEELFGRKITMEDFE